MWHHEWYDLLFIPQILMNADCWPCLAINVNFVVESIPVEICDRREKKTETNIERQSTFLWHIYAYLRSFPSWTLETAWNTSWPVSYQIAQANLPVLASDGITVRTFCKLIGEEKNGWLNVFDSAQTTYYCLLSKNHEIYEICSFSVEISESETRFTFFKVDRDWIVRPFQNRRNRMLSRKNNFEPIQWRSKKKILQSLSSVWECSVV